MSLEIYKDKIVGKLEIITSTDIKNIEEKYDFVFPPLMKEFYLMYNGGEVEKDSFFISDCKYGFDLFFSIKYGKCTMEKNFYLCDFGKNDYELPPYLIPFASDQGGNDFYFSVKEGEEENIYYIDHESYEDESDIQYICKNISDFLFLLT